MAGTAFSGPQISWGQMANVQGIPDYNEVAGPDLSYQGTGLLDVRYVINKDNIFPGTLEAFFNVPQIASVDAVPQTLSNTAIVNAVAVAGAGAVTLTATSTKAVCAGTPVVPNGSSTAVSTLGLDLGFQTVNVNATATVTIAAGTAQFFPIGSWIYIGGTGGAAGTFTRIVTNAGLSTTTTMTVFPVPSNTNATAPVATTNLTHPYIQDANARPTSVFPWVPYGAGGFFDPTQSVARTLRYVSSNVGDTTQTVTVRGYDVFLNPMAETASLNGTTQVLGKKAFKYILSVTASAALAGNLSVGTTDTFGLNVRVDRWEYLLAFMNGALITTSTGWTTSDQAVATATTGDVRGTYTVQSASDGTKRFTVYVNLPLYNAAAATPAVPASMYGATQFTS